MADIDIKIRPNPGDSFDDVIKLVDRLLGSLERDENLVIATEKLGEALLAQAKENVSTGYVSELNWEPRADITQRLYELSPYHRYASDEGMDTGAGKLVNSLDRGDELNIFRWEGSGSEGGIRLAVGTSFKFAWILEKGGDRYTSEDWPSLGVVFDRKKGVIRPAKWLQQAISDGQITWEEVMDELVNKINTLPPRPFMEPAVQKLRDTRGHVSIFGDAFIREIIDDYRIEILTWLTRGERPEWAR